MNISMKINEQKDRPSNPYYRHREVDILEDDYSEISGPNDVCIDWGTEKERMVEILARRERSIR